MRVLGLIAMFLAAATTACARPVSEAPVGIATPAGITTSVALASPCWVACNGANAFLNGTDFHIIESVLKKPILQTHGASCTNQNALAGVVLPYLKNACGKDLTFLWTCDQNTPVRPSALPKTPDDAAIAMKTAMASVSTFRGLQHIGTPTFGEHFAVVFAPQALQFHADDISALDGMKTTLVADFVRGMIPSGVPVYITNDVL